MTTEPASSTILQWLDWFIAGRTLQMTTALLLELSYLITGKPLTSVIDQKILITKLSTLNLKHSIINWIIEFFTNRQHRIKIAEGCVSEWGWVCSGVPQGTELGPRLVVIIINDSSILDALLWKYVDDTTVSEIIPKGQSSSAHARICRFCGRLDRR